MLIEMRDGVVKPNEIRSRKCLVVTKTVVKSFNLILRIITQTDTLTFR